MKKAFFLGMLALVLGACSYQAPKATITPSETPTVADSPTATVEVPKKKTVTLSSENDSGQKGSAVFEETSDGVRVTINMAGPKVADPQPAHIHIGVCPGVGAVKYPLTNVVSGKSVTMLTLSMGELLNQGPLAINVHKSVAEANVYVACGGL